MADEYAAAMVETLLRLARENDALRVKLGATRIGSGVDLVKFDVVFVCRACGELAQPDNNHACVGPVIDEDDETAYCRSGLCE
jgi:hypothetical protein